MNVITSDWGNWRGLQSLWNPQSVIFKLAAKIKMQKSWGVFFFPSRKRILSEIINLIKLLIRPMRRCLITASVSEITQLFSLKESMYILEVTDLTRSDGNSLAFLILFWREWPL